MNHPSFDPAAVLTTLQNNVGLYQNLCDLFLETAPKMMADLRDAAQGPDTLAVARACHLLRGSALILQADELVFLLGNAEEALRAGRQPKEDAWVENIALALDRILQEVEASLPLPR